MNRTKTTIKNKLPRTAKGPMLRTHIEKGFGCANIFLKGPIAGTKGPVLVSPAKDEPSACRGVRLDTSAKYPTVVEPAPAELSIGVHCSGHL